MHSKQHVKNKVFDIIIQINSGVRTLILQQTSKSKLIVGVISIVVATYNYY